MIFYYLGSEIPKSCSITFLRGPPGPVCHNQKENSFSHFVALSPVKPIFFQLKEALQVQVQLKPKKIFPIFLTPLRCVKQNWDIWGFPPPASRFFRDWSEKIQIFYRVGGGPHFFQENIFFTLFYYYKFLNSLWNV